jgi:subtilisin family serine protease
MHRPARRLAALLFALTGLVAACSEQPSSPTTTSSVSATPATLSPNGRYLVEFRQALPSGPRTFSLGAGARITREHPEVNLMTVEGLSVADAQALAARPEVATVVADAKLQWIPAPGTQRSQLYPSGGHHVRVPGTDQSTALAFPLQWNITQIAADRAWSRTPGGRGELVCVLDSGIDPEHPDLAGKIDLAVSFSTDTTFAGNADPLDYNGHGTGTAGLVSSNGIVIASVAPDVRLCSAKVLGDSGSGSFGDIFDAIIWAAAVAHADVINMSLGAYIDLREPGARELVGILQHVLNFANRKGAVIVAAAGNEGIDLDHDPRRFLSIPAQLNHVVSVGATGPVLQIDFDQLAWYSNFGGRSGIDLVAPGGNFDPDPTAPFYDFDLVLTTCSQYAIPGIQGFDCELGDYLIEAGTSASAPHVSGAAAVIESALGGGSSPDRIEQCLENGANRVGPFRIFGAGRLNVLRGANCGFHDHDRGHERD